MCLGSLSSISVVMLCIAILGMLHKNLDVHGSSFIDRRARIVMRLTAAAIFALLPIKQDWRSLHYLGIHAAVLAWVVGFETFGKLGAVGRRYDSERAAALKKAFVGQGQDIAMGDLETGRHSRSSASRGAEKRMSDSAQNVLSFGRRKLNKGWDRGVPRRASWHEHSDLTPAERGEEDVGIESELGNLEEKELSTGQRWALAH